MATTRGMECARCRELLSARFDGETDAETPAAERHLASCPSCRTFVRDLERLGRQVRLRPADPVPDLSMAILARAVPPKPAARRYWARVGLVVVALLQLLLAVPALVLGDDDGASIHVARHIGSFDVAVAVALLLAAWRPERARGLLPVGAVLSASLLGTAVIDMLGGHAAAFPESQHVLEVVGSALLWLIVEPTARRRGATRRDSARLAAV